MRLALGQMNATIGDFAGNGAKIESLWKEAEAARPLGELARRAGKTALLAGTFLPNPSKTGKPLFNAAVLLRNGRAAAVSRKCLLPAYDGFDEVRHFEPGKAPTVVRLGGRRIGLTICEDLWNDKDFFRKRRLYRDDPGETLLSRGADRIVNVSASPFSEGKPCVRRRMLSRLARDGGVPVIYVNLVGGNDELVFDGGSMALDGRGRVRARAALFEEDFVLVDLDGSRVTPVTGSEPAALPDDAEGESLESLRRALAEALGIRFEIVPIEPLFAGRPDDVTEENLQARIRGMLLMAFSNKLGPLLLTTGNKSELAVGYCTLYGDMAGGLAPISDLPKMRVYALARHLNRRAGRELIPASTLEKAPSAELRPGQTDQDSLPPYGLFDRILEGLVERNQTPAAVAREVGAPVALAAGIARQIDRAESKRQQAAPGLRVSTKAFGSGRRLPIAQVSKA